MIGIVSLFITSMIAIFFKYMSPFIIEELHRLNATRAQQPMMQ